MKKGNVFLWGMPAVLLVFTLVLAGCDNDTTSGVDTWSDITSLEQLNGTWKGSGSSSEEEDGITITATWELTITINASAQTLTGTVTITMTFAGAGIEQAWSSIKDDLGEGVEFDNSKHSATMTQDMGTQSITLEEMNGVQINQDGTKLKIPEDAMDDGSPEMTLIKQ
jgi:hypothetical protein